MTLGGKAGRSFRRATEKWLVSWLLLGVLNPRNRSGGAQPLSDVAFEYLLSVSTVKSGGEQHCGEAGPASNISSPGHHLRGCDHLHSPSPCFLPYATGREALTMPSMKVVVPIP